MCRADADGGRRCPCDRGDARRARQRAAYQRRKAASTPTTVPDSQPGHEASHGTAEPGTPQAVAEAVEHARTVMDSAGPLTREDENGWLTPTEDGLAVEAAVRSAGEAVSARAEVLARQELDDYGPVVVDGPAGGRFDSFEEYKAHLEDLRDNGDADTSWEAKKKLLAIDSGVDDYHLAMARREPEAYIAAHKAALAEQRDLGIPKGTDLNLHKGSHKTAVARLHKAMEVYPSDWIDKENNLTLREKTFHLSNGEDMTVLDRFPMRVTTTSGRAYYADGRIEKRGNGPWQAYSDLRVDTSQEGYVEPGVSTAIHEYGHRQEILTPQVNEVCKTFLARRTSDENGQRHRLHRLHAAEKPGPLTKAELNESRQEWVRPNGFVDQYVGKDYGGKDTNTEVFTMGMEGVFAGKYGGLRGDNGRHKADPEHRNLILGVLSSVR